MSTPALVDAIPDEIIVLDETGMIIASNEAWRRFCDENGGNSTNYYVGTNYLNICGSADGESSALASIVTTGLNQCLQDGEPFRCEYPCDSPTVKRWFEMTVNRFVDQGKAHLFIQHRNITTRHVELGDIEAAFVNSSALSALVATSTDAILSYDLNGKIIIWNRAAERLYGYSDVEAVGQSLEILYPPSWPKNVEYYRDEIIAGRLQGFEATRVAKDGVNHEVWITCATIRSTTGEVVAISNIHRDVTELRKAEREREIISQEVIHRAKNMLGIVSAIQRQTARVEETIEGFNHSFEARINSLSKSTDLLVNGGWTTVLLHDLVRSHLDPFVNSKVAALIIDGPPVKLMPQAVQTIGMAIHELATNSTKHGVLKQDSGKIDVSWGFESDDRTSKLQFHWLETGIEANLKRRRSGFGNTVLTSLARSMLDAKVEFDIGQERVIWSILVPREHVASEIKADDDGGDLGN